MTNGQISQNLNRSLDHELNYVTANRFYVEIERDIITACFSECSGLGVQVEKETYLEGGVNEQQRIFLKQAKFNDVTLKRGITNDVVFWDWGSQILNPGEKERRNVHILVFNQAGITMQCWTLIGAIPVGWKAPSLQANSNTAAIEELTLAYEGLKIIVNKNKLDAKAGGASINVKRHNKTGEFSSN
jgi:phage tail-like protein